MTISDLIQRRELLSHGHGMTQRKDEHIGADPHIAGVLSNRGQTDKRLQSLHVAEIVVEHPDRAESTSVCLTDLFSHFADSCGRRDMRREVILQGQSERQRHMGSSRRSSLDKYILFIF